ncbi:MAG: hypothetical protein AAF388_02310 [Bacteroidota bacterium]
MFFPRTVLCLLFLSFFLGSYAQGESPLFASDEVLELQIHTDIPAIQGDRKGKELYRSATLKCSKEISIPVEVKVRGNFRKRPDICDFPPLKLKLPDSESQQTPFDGQSKLKLVTHCQGDELVLKEYLAYKTLNLLTENSFKVRLVKIKYKDLSKTESTESHYGIILESVKHMAERMGGEEIEEVRLAPEEISEKEMALLCLYNYMIGNTDWDVTLEKNIKIVGFDDQKAPVIVPYDFDMSGAVMAPYSDKYIGSAESRRRFTNLVVTRASMEAAIFYFKEKKSEIFELYQSFSLLKKKESEKILEYYTKFFQLIESPDLVESKIMNLLPGEEMGR